LADKDSKIKDLNEQLRKQHENLKEMKNVVEIYKSNKQSSLSSLSSSPSSKDITKTRNYQGELEEAKIEIRRLKESLEKYKSNINQSSKSHIPTQQVIPITNNTINDNSKMSSPSTAPSDQQQPPMVSKNEKHNKDQLSDYSKKIKSLEELVRDLHKSLNNKKQEETALLNDMEITGQAFEDMQVFINNFFLNNN
jgi:chromosome segregation ATPase